MEENTKFRSDFYYDLPAFQEFNKLLTHSMGRNTFMNLLTWVCLLFLLTQLENRTTLILTLILNGYWIFYNVFRHVRNKDGGIAYQQILHANEDSIPHQIVTLEEEGIRSRNPRTGKEILDSYDSVRYIMESQNLLVLVTDLKMCHIFDKRYMSGGNREELIAHLRETCPKLQKRIKTGKLGIFVSKALLVTAAVGLLLGGFVIFRQFRQDSQKLRNSVSYTEMAQELQSAGISISDQTIRELEAYDAEYAAEHGDYYTENPEASKVFDLLYWEGAGIWDEETWEWTPSESGLYWFDTEIMFVDAMYTDFFRGLNAMDENLAFDNVMEDYSKADIEAGTGTVAVSFDYEDKHYQLEAKYDYDWFDLGMIKSLGQILSTDSQPEMLWYVFDGGQGVLLFYGTDAEVKILEQKTGMDFRNGGLIGILE